MSHDAPQIATQIAWIGNSFVFFNKLPRMLAGMLAHDGTQVKQKDVLVGGQGLPGHSLDQNVTKLLAQQKWDFVILQDQSAVPGMSFCAPSYCASPTTSRTAGSIGTVSHALSCSASLCFSLNMHSHTLFLAQEVQTRPSLARVSLR
jgi:hypothetical protein